MPGMKGSVPWNKGTSTWRTNKKGYRYKYVQEDGKRKLLAEHRHVIEMAIGRKLGSHEVVHHVNGNPSDNRIENLEVMSKSQHMKRHYDEFNTIRKNNGEPEYITLECSVCGKVYTKLKWIRTTASKNKNATKNNPACSPSCWGKLLNAYRYGKDPKAMKEE